MSHRTRTEVPSNIKETKQKHSSDYPVKVDEILKYKTVQYWLDGLSPITKRNYMKHFPLWLDHTKKRIGTNNPDTLIEMRISDSRSNDRKQRKRFEHIAKTWYHEIYDQYEKTGKSTGHAKNHLKTVQSFFSRNDIPLKFRRGEIRAAKKKIKRIPIELEDLKTAYTMLEIRDKAIFATLLQSGLSVIDVCALNIEDVIDRLDKPPVYLEGYREKTDVRYQTCIGDDAAIAIKKYLILRENPKKGILFETKFGERMTPRGIRYALSPVRKVIKSFKVKMLRDFFHDALERAGIKEATASRMFGHKIGGAKGEYLFAPETIRQSYDKTYLLLKINGSTRAVSRDKSLEGIVQKLAEIVVIIATGSEKEAINTVTKLMLELQGKELNPEAKKLFENRMSRELTHEEKIEFREKFNDTVKRYLKAI